MKKTIMNIARTSAAIAVSVAFAACESDVFDISKDPFKNETYSTLLTSPISTTLEEDGNFTEYVKMLNYSGYYSALNQCTDGVSYTAFAPNDEAMQEFYQRRGVTALEDLSKEYAQAFVQYHTVSDSILADAFVTKESVTNLSGDKISISINADSAGEALLNGEGHVIEMARSAYNGKIYVLSRAMTPLVETVYDRIVDSGTSNIMVAAINEAGWAKRLTTVRDTVVQRNESGVMTQKITTYNYTVLNVSDATFAKAGIADLASLKSSLAANDERGLSSDSLLKEYVGYHIFTNNYTVAELATMSGSSLTRIMDTSASNQVITFTVDTLIQGMDSVTINAQGQSAKFVSDNSNVLAKNGYVHEIDNYLPVWNPDQSLVLWDLADYTEIKNLVPSDQYQPKEKPSKANRTRVSTASCFTYEMGASGSKNVAYSDIDYLTPTLDTPNNHDCIVFNLGYMGYAQMNTPTIIKGKYRVEIDIVYNTTQSFMRKQTDGNGGLMRFSFDDNEDMTTYASPYTKIVSDRSIVPAGVYTSTVYDEIVFEETASHTMKFVVLDPAASTNAGFSIQIDCIRFIPIE